MSFNLQQAPDRLRKTLYRSDHFWVDTRNISTQPRYKTSTWSSDQETLRYSNQEAVISIALDGSTPYRDVFIDTADSHLWINGVVQNTAGTTASQIVTCSNSGSYTITDTPVWYSNALVNNASTYTGYKTKWNPSFKPTVGDFQNSEMREPVGLSKYMLYYNRVTPYRKKFRITFTPCQTNRLRAITSGTPAHGLALAGANGNDSYDSPYMLKNWAAQQSNTTVSFGHPKMKLLVGGFEKRNAQYASIVPFWLENKSYPIPISSSQEGFKLGVFEYSGEKSKPIVWEYTTSIESTYGKKVDMASVYYTNNGLSWAANNEFPTWVNFFIYSLENSPDCGYLPFIQGHFRIESWVDCLFWDRKHVQVAFNISTEEDDGVVPTSIAGDTELLELETQD